MEFSGYPVKESYQLPNHISSGDSTASRLQTEVGIFNQRITGLGSTGPSVSTGVDSGSARESENSILSVDVSYKQKLRAGFIDFRNSINDNKYRGVNLFPKTSHGFLGREPLARSCDIPVYTAGETSRDRGFQTRSYKKFNDRRKLYRSNSSLELDHCNNDAGRNDVSVLLKDFGSANSLDAVQPGAKDFASMLYTYRQDIENLDRPSHAKPSDATRGAMINASIHANRMSHHFVASVPTYTTNPVLSCIDGNAAPVPDHPHGSPKQDQKFQKTKDVKARNEGGGIFRKLRGVKSDPSAAVKSSSDGGSKSDVSFKAFCHYDCQSIGVRLVDVIRRRVDLTNDASFKRLNVTTGASAASVARMAPSSSATDLENMAQADDSDAGDGKSNDLLLSCAFFHNELGAEGVRSVCIDRSNVQRRSRRLSSAWAPSVSAGFVTDPMCNGVAVLDASLSPEGAVTRSFQSAGGFVFEYFDQGAFYYRSFFNTYDHQNFFGIDENVGPVAISIKREKVFDKDGKTSSSEKATEGSGWFHQYRIIVRTSELTSLRGSVLEDNIPSSSRLSSAKGLLAKDILDFVVPNLSTSCLHQAVAGKKTSELLMKVDEQGISKAYKIGVMLCRSGQASEEEMYNNEFSSPAFDEFLNLIATRVKLKGFESYRGGLDIKSDSTGTESFYARLEDNEIMFHISTLLPFTPSNKQQLLRKRHIGNDIVTIIFQEPGALPFTPKSVRSQFQHVFIIVRVHNPNTENTKYSIAVSRSKNVPCFGPLIPEGATFPRSELFREFLLVKAINAENAVHRSDKFMAMAVRTRQEYLKDLATNQVISSSIESGSRLSKLTLGSGRKKDKARLVRIPDIHSKAAVVWSVQVDDFGLAVWVSCLLGIAQETIAIVEESTSSVLFATSCHLVIGWSLKQESLKLFYNEGECVHLTASTTELKEIVTRLEVVTIGCQAEEKTLFRNSDGHLGFHVYNGVVCDIDRTGPAFAAGLKFNCRIVEIGTITASTLTQDQLIELLRSSRTVNVSLIPPLEDGTPRSYKAHGDNLNPLWRQHISLQGSSNHSSLERKVSEKPRGSMNDLRASPDDMDAKAEGCHSNEHAAMFCSSYSAQNAYKGSQLSLSYKTDGNNTPRNSGLTGAIGPKPYSQVATLGNSRAGASQTAQGEDFKQAPMLNRNARDLHYQQQTAALAASGDWQTGGDASAGKTYGQNSRLAMTAGNDLQQKLTYSQSFNRGTTMDHGSPMKPQSGPDVVATSDSVNNDSRMVYRKSAALKTPNSRLTPSKSFQKDLIRLIDTEVPPSEIRFSSHKVSDDALESMGPLLMGHSDDNIWASSQREYSSLDSTRSDAFQQKMPSSNVIEIPGTIYRLQTSHSSSANIPLPVVSSTKDDWSSLLDAADRAFEGDMNDRGGGALGGGTLGRGGTNQSILSGMIQQPLMKGTKLVDPANSGIQLQSGWKASQQESTEVGQLTSSDSQKESLIVKELKARNSSLERQLKKERQERSLMEQQLDQLRQDNIRLQEESQTAAAQLRKFTEWFFHTIDQ